MGTYVADTFTSSVKKILGDSFTTKWEKVTTDKYKIIVFANLTGQKWEQAFLYDDFRGLDPRIFAEAAFENLEQRARDFVNKTTTQV